MKYPQPQPHEGGDEARVMAQALSGPFFAGASLALLSATLPHAAHSDRPAFFAVIASAYLVSLVLFWNAERAPRWLSQVLLAAGTLHVTAVAYFSGERPEPAHVLLPLDLPLSAYFLSRKRPLRRSARGACFWRAADLDRPPSGVLATWLMGMGTLLVAAICSWR